MNILNETLKITYNYQDPLKKILSILGMTLMSFVLITCIVLTINEIKNSNIKEAMADLGVSIMATIALFFVTTSLLAPMPDSIFKDQNVIGSTMMDGMFPRNNVSNFDNNLDNFEELSPQSTKSDDSDKTNVKISDVVYNKDTKKFEVKNINKTGRLYTKVLQKAQKLSRNDNVELNDVNLKISGKTFKNKPYQITLDMITKPGKEYRIIGSTLKNQTNKPTKVKTYYVGLD